MGSWREKPDGTKGNRKWTQLQKLIPEVCHEERTWDLEKLFVLMCLKDVNMFKCRRD